MMQLKNGCKTDWNNERLFFSPNNLQNNINDSIINKQYF